MKSAARTDEQLIKRAKYGARNVKGLAILATILAVVMLPALFLLPAKEGGASVEFLGSVVGLATISVAYWMLAITTRQGETLGLTVIIGILTTLLLLSLLEQVLLAARTNGANTTSLIVLIVPLLIILALISNRADMLELQRRGLATTIFGPGKPPRNLAILGGGLLGFGQLIIIAALLFPGINAARTARECHDFVTMIQVDEKAFLDVLGSPNRPFDQQRFLQALEAAQRLREKARLVESSASKGSKLTPIASKYLRAVDLWCIGVGEASNRGRVTPDSAESLQQGDQLREEALAEFLEQFPNVAPRRT